jgi:hypothetical protein
MPLDSTGMGCISYLFPFLFHVFRMSIDPFALLPFFLLTVGPPGLPAASPGHVGRRAAAAA